MRTIINSSRRLHSRLLSRIVVVMPDIYAYSTMIGAAIVAAASMRMSIYCFERAARARRAARSN